jgi:hypothetical protein
VENEQKRRPRFWPLLFLAAFILGASLWAVWMIHIINKTRANRVDGFFVPMAGQTAPSVNTNAAGTNSK